MANSSPSYAGNLNTKKKGELQDIAQALGLSEDGKREELATRIREHLEQNTGYSDDPVFTGLYTKQMRQRSIQSVEVTVASRQTGRSRQDSIQEEPESPTEDMNDVSVLLPPAPRTPARSPRKVPLPVTPSSLPPLPPSAPPSPAKSIIADALAQPEVQAVVEMERSVAKSSKQLLLKTRATVSNASTVFLVTAVMDLLSIATRIYLAGRATGTFELGVPVSDALKQLGLYLVLPTAVIPTVFAYILTFANPPAGSLEFDPLTASIVRLGATMFWSFIFQSPAKTVEHASIVAGLDPLGMQLRILTASLSLAFAAADAVGHRSS